MLKSKILVLKWYLVNIIFEGYMSHRNLAALDCSMSFFFFTECKYLLRNFDGAI